MDVLYIPQLDELGADAGSSGDASGGTAARYRLLKRVPEDGVVNLADRAVTRIEVGNGIDALRLVVPPEAKGSVRDFFARLVVTADEVPEISLAAPSGETISFEDADEDVFTCEVGVNVFAFTETDAGIFFVNRKRVDIDLEVAFDARGGTLDKASLSFKLGAMYSSLPKPTWTGYTFLGWFTEAEGGVEVVASDRCKTGVTALYAHWEVYVDPFVDAICPAKDMTFFSEGASPWTADGESARSGVIADGGSTSLTTTVQGKGTLAFRWKASSEAGYDCLLLSVDGAEKERISGESGDWLDCSVEIGADGSHDVAWTYTKDGSMSSGEDCGWVAGVSWTPSEG